MKNVPSTRPTSPTTLMTNALIPAHDERPTDDQQHEVARQDQEQHREDEEVEVGEKARVALVAVQIADRIEVDQHRYAGDDADHEDRERIDEHRGVGVYADCVGDAPEGRAELAVCGSERLQLDQGDDREDE
jgi:hypothetical protein